MTAGGTRPLLAYPSYGCQLIGNGEGWYQDKLENQPGDVHTPVHGSFSTSRLQWNPVNGSNQLIPTQNYKAVVTEGGQRQLNKPTA